MPTWNRTTHKKLIEDFRLAPKSQGSNVGRETNDLSIVRDFSDTIYAPPPMIDEEYVSRLERAAAYLGFSDISEVSAVRKATRDVAFPSAEMTTLGSRVSRQLFSSKQGSDSSSNESLRNRAMHIRNVVFDFMNQVGSFVARAKNAGFSPPDNPFVRIAELNTARNSHRQLVLPDQIARDIVVNIGAYVDLLKAVNESKFNFDRDLNSAAQLSSINMSFEGFGGSNDSAVDLLRFLPDMDMVKRRKAEEALSVLDFKKRRPKILFTSNYSPDGKPARGAIVGWRRMPDASGYVLTRRNIFDGTEKQTVFVNSDLDLVYSDLKEYVKTWVIGFYDNVDPEKVYAILDEGVAGHSFYTYKLQAFQTYNESKGAMFSVDTFKSNLTPSARNQIKSELETLSVRQGADSVSPYPVLAQRLLGDSRHDWILAAVNVRASVNRNDDRTTTRRYSYLAAQLDFIFKQMDAGKFVVPSDVNDVIKNIKDGLARLGITQVIQEVLNDTGSLFHFEGKDADEDDPYFDRVGSKVPETSDLVSTVVAAIDPETALLDIRSLATNVSLLLAGGFGMISKQSYTSRSEEIDVPETNAENIDDDRADDQVQFLQKLGDLDDAIADLTTFDGISKFIRSIRLISDYGPTRGPAVTVEAQSMRPEPPPPETTVTRSRGTLVTPETPVTRSRGAVVTSETPTVTRRRGTVVVPPDEES